MDNTTRRTITVFGLELQVIADLDGGYFLALHPHGPAIANDHSLHALSAGLDDDLPAAVQLAAVRAYVTWSWPLLLTSGDPASATCSKYVESDVQFAIGPDRFTPGKLMISIDPAPKKITRRRSLVATVHGPLEVQLPDGSWYQVKDDDSFGAW